MTDQYTDPPPLGLAGKMANSFIHSPLSPLFFFAKLVGKFATTIPPRIFRLFLSLAKGKGRIACGQKCKGGMDSYKSPSHIMTLLSKSIIFLNNNILAKTKHNQAQFASAKMLKYAK
ncbi:hypothetical protein THIOM_004303 [Candidatus Thiomargarita nelsonii]|uniref:Uncharacterized protein n=1 Tax=Candidatus Thiomargarita nelsonii TaxID=1003181 RepID=A0A176RWB0_9GAMM|nr:hypothetical protein THIOM_004303 [Candidatus Thiomargarita nelsonii]